MPTAFITGANRGLGLALCHLLLSEGYRVFGTYRRTTMNPDLAKLHSDHPAQLTLFDIEFQSSAAFMVLENFKAKWGPVDLLINNAAISIHPAASLAEMNFNEFRYMLDVNTIGPMRVTQLLMASLLSSERPIVANVSSQLGSLTQCRSGQFQFYRATKAALNMLTLSLSYEYPNVRFMVVHPGHLKTRMGGATATTSADESARKILTLINTPFADMKCRFLNQDGATIPW